MYINYIIFIKQQQRQSKIKFHSTFGFDMHRMILIIFWQKCYWQSKRSKGECKI